MHSSTRLTSPLSGRVSFKLALDGIAVAVERDAIDTMLFMRNPLLDVRAGGAIGGGSENPPSLSLRRSATESTAGIVVAFSETPSGVREPARIVWFARSEAEGFAGNLVMAGLPCFPLFAALPKFNFGYDTQIQDWVQYPNLG
jgi:hypothetical protein